MNVALPPDIESKLSPQDVALNLAIGLFASEVVTLGQGAEIADMSQADFLKELGKRKICIHYGAEELAADLEVRSPVR